MQRRAELRHLLRSVIRSIIRFIRSKSLTFGDLPIEARLRFPDIPQRPFARISRAEIRAPARISSPPKPYFDPAKKLRWSDIETARTAPIWVSQRPQRAQRIVPSGDSNIRITEMKP
jgi:hypothetical protein